MTIVYKKKKVIIIFFFTLHNKILAQNTIDPPKKIPRAVPGDIPISFCGIFFFFLFFSIKVDTRYIRMRRSLRTKESYHEVISYTHTHTHTHTSAHTNMNIVHFRSDFGNCGSHVLGKALTYIILKQKKIN